MTTNTHKAAKVPVVAEHVSEAYVAERLWTIDDLATYFGVTKPTIYDWRAKKYGPPAVRAGRHLRWRPESVERWARAQEEPAA